MRQESISSPTSLRKTAVRKPYAGQKMVSVDDRFPIEDQFNFENNTVEVTCDFERISDIFKRLVQE